MADKPSLVSRVKELGTLEALAADPKFKNIVGNVYPLTGKAGKERVGIDHTLGEGTYGRVNLEELDEGHVAVKYFTDPEESISENIGEVAALKYIQGMPYVAQLIHVDPRPAGLAVNAIAPSVVENMPFPALVMGAAKGTLDENHLLKSWTDLFSAVKDILLGYHILHSNGIVHRDTKPSNMLMTRAGEVWITDFGMSRYIDKNIPVTRDRYTGTYWYASPEILLNNLLDDGVDDFVKSDIWAVGASILHVLTGRAFFTDNVAVVGDDKINVLWDIFKKMGNPTAADGRTFELLQMAQKNGVINPYTYPPKKGAISTHILYNSRFTPLMNRKLLRDLANLIERMLDFDPAKRPSLAEVLSDPIFNVRLDRLPTRPSIVKRYAFDIPVSNDIKKSMLEIVFEWLYNVVTSAPKVIFSQASARVVLDRTGCYFFQFLNVYKDNAFVSKKNLQLIGATSLFIATALFDESKYSILSLEELEKYGAGAYTKDDLLVCIKMFMVGDIQFYGSTVYDLIATTIDYDDAKLDTLALLNYVCYQKNLFEYYEEDIPGLIRKIVEFATERAESDEYLKRPALRIRSGAKSPEMIQDFVEFLEPKEGGSKRKTRKVKKSLKKKRKTRGH